MTSRVLALSVCPARQPSYQAILQQGRREAKAILGRGSKSFALAGMLLGRRARDDAAVLYAWCRRADDRVDEVDRDDAPAALANLDRGLDDLFDGRVSAPLDVALHELVSRRHIPKDYFKALLDGFAMDAEGAIYRTFSELDLYAYRVAGVVGLMMCHVLGVRDDRCLRAAAHLGMAMQLTNIARDVAEDLARGRQYLPTELVSEPTLREAVKRGGAQACERVSAAVAAVLRRADDYYRSGLAGIAQLGWRDALAIGAAGRIYRAIGRIITRRKFDVLAGRAVVPLPRKLGLALISLAALVGRASRPSLDTQVPSLQVPRSLVRFDDVQS
jgi:15-cis-phytoene synthase